MPSKEQSESESEAQQIPKSPTSKGCENFETVRFNEWFRLDLDSLNFHFETFILRFSQLINLSKAVEPEAADKADVPSEESQDPKILLEIIKQLKSEKQELELENDRLRDEFEKMRE